MRSALIFPRGGRIGSHVALPGFAHDELASILEFSLLRSLVPPAECWDGGRSRKVQVVGLMDIVHNAGSRPLANVPIPVPPAVPGWRVEFMGSVGVWAPC
jgi:hypothetical protein